MPGTITERIQGPVAGVAYSNFPVMSNLASPPVAYLTGHTNTTTPLADLLRTPRFMPIRLQRRYRVVTLAIDLTAAGNNNAEVTRLGIYDHSFDTGGPNRLLKDFGTIATGLGVTPAIIECVPNAIDLGPGTYWLACIADSPGTLGTKTILTGSGAWMQLRNTPQWSTYVGYQNPAQGAGDVSLPPMASAATTTSAVVRVLMRAVGI